MLCFELWQTGGLASLPSIYTKPGHTLRIPNGKSVRRYDNFSFKYHKAAAFIAVLWSLIKPSMKLNELYSALSVVGGNLFEYSALGLPFRFFFIPVSN